jgi:hypothetical protein
MVEKKKMVQTTIRLESEKLREIQYYLSLERKSLSKLVDEKLTDFLQEYREQHPERIPGGPRASH